MKALLIPVGLDLYAVPMESVREVVADPRLCHLPMAPATVLGLFNLRGEIVPLFDTGALIGLSGLAAWPFAAVLVTARGPAGVAATGLPESAVLGDPIGPSESHCTTGIYDVGHRLAALIDIDALFAAEEIGGHGLVGSGREGS